ncbi:MAG: P-II family nitrogen regulator [Pseudomonadota bacterium]
MRFKLIVAFVEDGKTEPIMDAAREAGATGCTIISNARGEGIKESKSFFGLTLAVQRDVLLLLVEEHLSRRILEHIAEVGEFDSRPGTGIAVVIDVEDAVGIMRQAEALEEIVEENR